MKFQTKKPPPRELSLGFGVKNPLEKLDLHIFNKLFLHIKYLLEFSR